MWSTRRVCEGANGSIPAAISSLDPDAPSFRRCGCPQMPFGLGQLQQGVFCRERHAPPQICSIIPPLTSDVPYDLRTKSTRVSSCDDVYFLLRVHERRDLEFRGCHHGLVQHRANSALNLFDHGWQVTFNCASTRKSVNRRLFHG